MKEFENATKIVLDADTIGGTVRQIRVALGGKIEERWGEHTLAIANENATGSIRFITLDWGVSLLEFDITFHIDVILVVDSSRYNPIQFNYCLLGNFGHRFESDKDIKTLDQFQSVIITSKNGGHSYSYFPKDEELKINIIQIIRKEYLQKRLNNVSQLNKKLYEVFMDSDHENSFAYFGVFNLKMAAKIGALRKLKSKGIIRIMQIEGMIYQILSMHIRQHDRALKGNNLPTNLLKSELQIIRNLAKDIVKNPSFDYSLENLSQQSGLSQAKLQEGFKLMFARTVTEYIRHIRLEEARDLIANSELNISEIVYTIGFSSRSYFSKIFKKKYNISPSEFKSISELVPNNMETQSL